MQFPDARIMVFAKAPVPGAVKTRLIPQLGAQGAAHLHEELAQRSLGTALNAALCPVQLWCSPSVQHEFFTRCRQRYALLTLACQHGPDLGARMAQAFTQTLAHCRYAVVIGTDCPALAAADLRAALSALQEGYDAVLGPAQDGGYVLLGLRRFDATLFEDIAWGGDKVAELTRAHLRALGWRWHELATQWDVDRPEDLARLAELLKNSNKLQVTSNK